MSKSATPTDGNQALALRNVLVSNLRRHARVSVDDHGRKAAAVAVALVKNDAGEDCFILTRRAEGLRAHGGQWALPGGRIDVGEAADVAALRELSEEIGLTRTAESVLGLLDDYPTRSGYTITPVVVWCGEDGGFRPNPSEVAEVHRIPVRELLGANVATSRRIAQSDRPVISIPLLGTDIHAPTAAVLYQFREVGILGRSTRVAHYDQPVFAWK
jgi:mutator protein MutT